MSFIDSAKDEKIEKEGGENLWAPHPMLFT
jgi:hypothetical protein